MGRDNDGDVDDNVKLGRRRLIPPPLPPPPPSNLPLPPSVLPLLSVMETLLSRLLLRREDDSNRPDDRSEVNGG